MSNAVPNITDGQVAVKTFADRTVRTNKERIVSDCRAESVFWRREKGIKLRNVKPKLSHASREFGDANRKFLHG